MIGQIRNRTTFIRKVIKGIYKMINFLFKTQKWTERKERALKLMDWKIQNSLKRIVKMIVGKNHKNL